MSDPRSRAMRGCCFALFVVFFFPSVSDAQGIMVDRANVEAWIFGQYGGSEQARSKLQAEIDLKISAAGRDFPLTDAQKQRLELAGHGDIKRFYDRVNAVHAQIQQVEIQQNNFNEVYQLTVPLQTQLRSGLFSDDSLFDKVLLGTLSPRQMEAKAAADRERRHLRAEVAVKAYISTLTRSIPFTAAQRDGLTEWLIDAVQGDDLQGQYAQILIQYRLSKLPEQQLDELLDDAQMKAIKQLTANARGFENFLRQQGLLKEDDQVVKP